MNHLLEIIMRQVSKPVRYMGNEYNMVKKDPDKVDIRFAFAFPDIYEVGMSHLGLRILYRLLNEREDTYCERVFAPWVDMEEQMRRYDIPLFTLETRTPINKFDFVGFTLQYELSYTNVLNILDLGQIPLRWEDRDERHPFVIAGGPCAYNSEPLADFLDLVVIGDGEEVVHELLDLYKKWKKEGAKKEEFLIEAARITGIYVPRFYSASYDQYGRVSGITKTRSDVPDKIQKRIVRNLDRSYFPQSLIVPYAEIVHDRVMLEIFRGCSRGCRFCQAGMIYRPVRERSLEGLLELADRLIRSTGYEEISLVSLSSGDYSKLEELVRELIKRYQSKGVSVALPSLRIDSFSKDFVEEIQKVRKTGLTFAPEAGTQRLRDVINKGVTEKDLLESVTAAFRNGWDRVKLYFMVGLPTETEEDIRGIAELAEKVVECYRQVNEGRGSKRLKVTVSTSCFVPKPFTPFQWEVQDPIEQLKEKQKVLKQLLRKKHIVYNWHDPKQSFIEAVLSRGDRRLGKVIWKAWKRGSHFDGWTEYFNFQNWMEAFETEGLNPEFYANRKREKNEIFPWEHIDAGVTRGFLWNEYERALRGELTSDCRIKCSGCGMRRLGEGICQ